MKKFLTRALPFCLALLIFVGSMALPAFAAENDSFTISGTWVFTNLIPGYENMDSSESLYFDFYYDGVLYSYLDLYDVIMVIDRSDENYVTIFEDGDPVGSAMITVVGSAELSRRSYDILCSVAYCADNTPLEVVSGNGLSIFSVFSGISGWIVSSIGTIMPMFYTEATGLTFIGTLAVAALALGVCFLIVALIRRFLNFG